MQPRHLRERVVQFQFWRWDPTDLAGRHFQIGKLLAAAQLAELPVDEERWADAGASPAPARAGHEDRSMVYI